MISISKICCGTQTEGDNLRYGDKTNTSQNIYSHGNSYNFLTAQERRPVVVWNITRKCNLSCIHCYTDSENKNYEGELTFDDGKNIIDDLSSFKIPALLISGGEPLMRNDVFDLISYGNAKGLRITLSTNGTLITKEIAQKIKDVGVRYVGISLDGIGDLNDFFRGIKGAYNKALQGIRNCLSIGQKVGLRLTLTKHNLDDLNNIFDFIERENIERVCFYHLVYSGRASKIYLDDLSHEETRQAIDLVIQRTIDLHNRGFRKDILTVDNHVDGVYLYLKLKEIAPQRAEKIYQLLKWNGGGLNSSGVGIGCIDYFGNVHPDQFWQHYSFGNVKERPFSDIWQDTSDELMLGLKNRKGKIKGRCAKCHWFDICGGSLRVRADLVLKDSWEMDPACYLTDKECLD